MNLIKFLNITKPLNITLILAIVFMQSNFIFITKANSGVYEKVITNYPNPFDSRKEYTTIVYFLTSESEVIVKIYDLLGNLVREYPSKTERAGVKTFLWDGTDDSGEKVSKGGYICIVTICNNYAKFSSIRKIGVIH